MKKSNYLLNEYEPKTLSEEIADSHLEIMLFLCLIAYVFLFFWSWQFLPNSEITFFSVIINFLMTTFFFVVISPVLALFVVIVTLILPFFIWCIEKTLALFK